MKNRIFAGMAILAAVALVSGASLLAAAASGSQNDPLVTMSYLTGVFEPQIKDEMDRIEKGLTEKFEAQLAAYESGLKMDPDDFDPDMQGNADVFAVVTLSNGKQLACSVGTEIMLRIGTAEGVGSSAPALVDYTDGRSLLAGAPLTANHMYLVTIEGNGINATSDLVRVLVRGNYTIK